MQQQAAASAGRDIKLRNAQHNIFHRTSVLAGFGVRDASADGYKVTGFYRETFLPHLEITMSAGDEKQLGASVGMEG